jgi:hypothetical protein
LYNVYCAAHAFDNSSADFIPFIFGSSILNSRPSLKLLWTVVGGNPENLSKHRATLDSFGWKSWNPVQTRGYFGQLWVEILKSCPNPGRLWTALGGNLEILSKPGATLDSFGSKS